MAADGGERFVIDGLVRGVATLCASQYGYVVIDTEHGYEKLFQVRPFVLAVTVGDGEGGIYDIVIAIDTDGGRIEVGFLRVDGKDIEGVLGYHCQFPTAVKGL